MQPRTGSPRTTPCPPTLTEIQSALMAFGPVVFGMSWLNSMFTPRSGVLACNQSSGVAGGHAILCVGWTVIGGATYLILRNSWGTTWGVLGEAFLPVSALALVGEVWKAVDVIEPAPVPPVPTSELTMQLLSRPARLFDGPVPANKLVSIPVAGLMGIDANATGAVLTLRVVAAPKAGWVYAGPDQGAVPTVSTLDYAAGLTCDGFPIVALTEGRLTVYSTQPLGRLVIDATGFLAS